MCRFGYVGMWFSEYVYLFEIVLFYLVWCLCVLFWNEILWIFVESIENVFKCVFSKVMYSVVRCGICWYLMYEVDEVIV